MDQVCYASEHSEVDPKGKQLTLKTRNVSPMSLSVLCVDLTRDTQQVTGRIEIATFSTLHTYSTMREKAWGRKGVRDSSPNHLLRPSFSSVELKKMLCYISNDNVVSVTVTVRQF